ncbi:hypothetical protein GCM10008090_14600 [Arenicella chitinivorans]|uniref:Pilus assembly protein n=1 Tax=Arenicella chitinivorans TaxID=1329800 RepID=A0A918RQA5_9GAMM|nr:hypothetical protein GCM10008090_14600 [Arenicella chitinivorans]
MLKAKLKASLIRLVISGLLLIPLAVVSLTHWYPNELMWAGGIQGLKLISLVDIVLGPILTFIVYQRGKKGLLSDLIIIGCLQCICFALGSWALYDRRPVAIVLADDGVHILSNHTVRQYTLKLPESEPSPTLVFLELPSDSSTWGTIKFSTEFADGIPLSYRDDLYKPLTSISDIAFKERIDDIRNFSDYSKPSNRSETEHKNETQMPCFWIPMYSKDLKGETCFNKATGLVTLVSHPDSRP